MARTRSKGIASPKTPTSGKSKKVGSIFKNSPAASPSVKKTKNVKASPKSNKSEQREAKSTPVVKKKVSNEEQTSIVSKEVALKAITALSKYVNNQKASKKSDKSSLFDDEDDEPKNNLYLQVNTKKFFSDKPQFKPKVIKLSKPIYDLDSVKTCLIIRDLLVTTSEQLEEIENANIPTLSQIYTLTQIKKEFKPFEKRRELYSSFDLFLVDDALMNLMPTALGKIFYGSSNNKSPLPIRVGSTSNSNQISITTLKNQVEKSLNSTYFLPPMGVNVSIKFGALSNDEDMLFANLNDVLATFESDSIKSIMMKSTDSPALPLFYTDKLYSEADVAEDKQDKETKKSKEVRLTAFEQGLLELGNVDEATKIIGKKLKQQNKNDSVKSNKVTKPSKTSKKSN